MPSVPVRQQYLFVIFFDTMHSEATEGVMHVWYLYFFGFEGCFGHICIILECRKPYFPPCIIKILSFQLSVFAYFSLFFEFFSFATASILDKK